MTKLRGSRPVAVHELPGADLFISDIQADTLAESVTIANRGELDQPLTGWALASLHGGEVFEFPEGLVVRAGRQVRVLSGEEARASAPGDLLWTRQPVWANRSDTVLLFDNQGHEVNRRTYPHAEIREERKPKLKVLIRQIDGYCLADWDDVVTPDRD